MEQLRNELTGLKQQIETWQQCYNPELIEFVWNRDLDLFIDEPERLLQVQMVGAADNPGAYERLHRQYLCPEGAAGKQFNKYMTSLYGPHYRQEKILILNKTPIHTPLTQGLRSVEREILRETQEYMAAKLGTLARLLEAPVWVQGLGERSGLFQTFFSRLGREQVPVYLTPHFSRACIFIASSYSSFRGENPVAAFAAAHPECTTASGNLSLNALLEQEQVRAFHELVVSACALERWA